METVKGEQETVEPTPPKIRLKAPVSRQELLRHTEHDPEGAEEFLALLRELRHDRRDRSDLE